MNVLFVCSRNQWRSPTAEQVFRRGYGINVRSAGTASSAKQVISAQDLTWADLVCVMEDKHKQRICAAFPRLVQFKKIVVLDIPDDYPYMDMELIELLQQSVQPLIQLA
ncbi:MAG: protein tyrosine phosphatase [Pseudomonadota bacterium]|nr:protein tyrosine phosphatase [Pseudomonadota bacterium]